MACEIVPEQVPFQSQIVVQEMSTPIVSSWYLPKTITDIPEDSVGWLVAQGWQITGISYQQNTQPPTARYAMTRGELQTELILQYMLGEYVFAYNNALTINNLRYNEVIADWRVLIATSHDYFDDMGQLTSDYNAAFAAALEEYMTDVEGVIAEHNTALGIAETTGISAAEALNDKLPELEANYNAHADLTRGYLTSLGATELARINEQFASTLSGQLQGLTDRGLYSSTRATDVTERNHRDRDEQIQALNDRLNRENVDNEHRLFPQLQDAVRGFIAGKAQYAAITSSNMVAVGGQRSAVISEKMGTYETRLNGLVREFETCLKLMQYMLEERNKLTVGMFGFVERREDIGPSVADITQVAVGLGDSGGGWIAP